MRAKKTLYGCTVIGPWKKVSVCLFRSTIVGVCRCCAPGTTLCGSAGGLSTAFEPSTRQSFLFEIFLPGFPSRLRSVWHLMSAGPLRSNRDFLPNAFSSEGEPNG